MVAGGVESRPAFLGQVRCHNIFRSRLKSEAPCGQALAVQILEIGTESLHERSRARASRALPRLTSLPRRKSDSVLEIIRNLKLEK